ncbi:MAG: hypothetical protein QOF16_66, partial [Actinomycetota bacterium]|nr:hypothetical protein [Actinomycetota bacterium]
LSFLNPQDGWVGQTLNGLFGIYPAPSIEMVLFHFLYLVPVGALFLVQTRKVPALPSKATENVAPARSETQSVTTS